VTFEEFAILASSEERWDGVTKLPWGDPAFSERMLREHLSQAHDGASRRFESVDRHVAWIHEEILRRSSARVLDLGCGPGLYTHRLAALGHACTGIDFAPAAIRYARERASSNEIFVLGDIRAVDPGGGYDLVMMVHGELNTFAREETLALLAAAKQCLARTGRLVLEAHTLEGARAIGLRPRMWASMQAGLFSDRPHLRLDESRWEERDLRATNLHWIIDAETQEVERHGTVTQAYSDDDYRILLEAAGLRLQQTYPSLGEGHSSNYTVFVAEPA
jgi:SAM-dependent methyltransferase